MSSRISHLETRSSNSLYTLFIPILCAIGHKSQEFLCNLQLLFSVSTWCSHIVQSIASLTTMTLMSFDIASTIFWRFSTSASVRLDMESLSSLLTPSTNSATSLLNFSQLLFGIPVSSITSCSIAAERLSSSF